MKDTTIPIKVEIASGKSGTINIDNKYKTQNSAPGFATKIIGINAGAIIDTPKKKFIRYMAVRRLAMSVLVFIGRAARSS